MTKIEWCDETINPIIGCTKISPACNHCYAEIMARRLSGMKATKEDYSVVLTNGKWNGNIKFRPNELLKPGLWKNPKKIFVVSMGDLFHEHIPFEWINAVFSMMSDYDHHTYLLLTKRPQRVLDFFTWKWKQVKINNGQYVPWFPKDNIWLGVTVENQEQAAKRIPILLNIPAKVRYLSCEPLLGDLNLKNIDAEMAGHDGMYFIDSLTGKNSDMGRPCPDVNKIDWVIAGGETGNNARVLKPEWVRSLRDQCKDSNVPFFFKKWGSALNKANTLLDGHIDCQEYHELPSNCVTRDFNL